MRGRTKKVWLSLAIVHLILVAFGAAQVRLYSGYLGSWLELYGLFSGSSSSYGFFAPGVGTGLRCVFEITDSKGFKFEDTLETARNREANLRIGNIVGRLSREILSEKARRAIAASWAAKMFQRYPNAKEVVVRAETLDVPSMEDYTKGVRLDWQTMYRAKFIRNKENGGKTLSR